MLGDEETESRENLIKARELKLAAGTPVDNPEIVEIDEFIKCVGDPKVDLDIYAHTSSIYIYIVYIIFLAC